MPQANVSEGRASANPEPPIQARGLLSLFLVSVLGLFVELMLIRWVGTEIRIFAYLQNTVLVVCFMGLAMGCMTCRRTFSLREFLWPLAGLTALLAVPWTREHLGGITEMLTVLGDFLIWSNGISGDPLHTVLAVVTGLGLTLVLMVLLWHVFVPLGRLTGRLMNDHPRTIQAYSVNVAGALVGIWLFVALSALSLPPFAWFALVAALTLPLVWSLGDVSIRRLDFATLGALILLAWFAGQERGAIEVHWSPYQKLVLREVDRNATDLAGIGEYVVTVNNAGYQGMLDLSSKNIEADPERYPPAMRGLSQYDIPFLVHPNPKSTLVVGAGSGNDVAGALRNGVEKVVGVEIDPAIIDLGRRYHPERPYDSPKVTVVNDDARSFFEGCKDKFDVVLFGLLDSHTTTAMTNARLDHYVYTRESFRRAKSLVADGGVMVLSFEAQKPFVADRMANALTEVFGEAPLCFRIPQTQYGWGGVMFVAGQPEAVRAQLAKNPRLAEIIAGWQKAEPVKLTGTTPITTDDWPYIYLQGPSIPLLYALLAALMAVLMVLGAKKLEIPGLLTGWGRPQWHFFFMGAAFLLLEVQNISKASVVLGNTWAVNAVVISGILATVLLANLVAAKLPKLPDPVLYGGLLLICMGLGWVDMARFGALPSATKSLAVGGLTSLPMLFSGVIFIQSFAATTRKDQALGANLIGSLAGALLQSVTFLVGIRALLWVVAGLYLAAMWTRPRVIEARTDEPEDARGLGSHRPLGRPERVAAETRP